MPAYRTCSLLLVAPALLLAQSSPSSRKHPPRSTSPGITAADATTRLYIVADDSMLGRDAGTIGNYKATGYIANELARLGLEPAGENGTYFQRVPLLNVRLVAGSRVAIDTMPLEFTRDVVAPIPDRRWHVRDFDAAPAIYGGSLTDTAHLLAPSLAAGKAVVVDLAVNAKGQLVTPPLFGLRRPGGRYANAAAVIGIGHYEDTVGFYSAALANRWANTFFTLDAPDSVAVPPALVMSRRAAQQIFDTPLSRLTVGETGRPIHGTLHYAVRDTAAARNVLARLRGSDPMLRGEYVAIGAHSDHVGVGSVALDHDSVRIANRLFRPLGADQQWPRLEAAQLRRLHAAVDSVHHLRPVRRDSIYNGADDDGSGTVALLEIAEAFATAPTRPRRSLLFAWHTAEEGGEVGSRWFTDHPTVPLDSIVAELQMDHVSRGRAEDTPGGGPRYVAVVGVREEHPPIATFAESANGQAAWPFNIDWSRGRVGAVGGSVACGSDQAMYDRLGIPSLLFFTGFHIDYHQPTDEPQYSDFDKLAHVAQLVHGVAARIADTDRLPPRLPALPNGRTACQP